MIIQDRVLKHVTGHVGSGNMLLNELFSSIGKAEHDREEVNWHDDLRVFIDNDNEAMTNVLFPAIKKHQKFKGHPNAYKIYIRPLEQCKEMYCNKFDIQNPEEKFTRENIISLARLMAKEQDEHIENGDYEN